MIACPPRRLLPIDRAFWDYTDRGELRIPRCAACSEYEWPPSEQCEACGRSEFAWAAMTGFGAIRSSCTFERKYYSELEPPWSVILVELDEGVLFVSNPWSFEVDDIEDGDRVRVRFVAAVDRAGPFQLPVFERVGDRPEEGTSTCLSEDLRGRSRALEGR